MYLQTKKIVFCIIDNTHLYSSDWIKSLMINQADYTVTNIVSKNYDLILETNEERALKKAAETGFKYAVVFSTGTEFINGDDFFFEIEKQTENEFFIAGHVLDRIDAYYELHNQCYVINLKLYADLGYPSIGKLEPGRQHIEIEPLRSTETFHDAHTPVWVKSGSEQKLYQHCCHGWNILRLAFEKNLPVIVFNNDIRNSKIHFYPENTEEFYRHLPWAYRRHNYCQNEFVHQESTDTSIPVLSNLRQVFTPASNISWTNLISRTEPVLIIYYDYNERALNYWKENVPTLDNVKYMFFKLDLLHDDIDISQYLDITIKETFINLSNIFAYEGTAFFNSLIYRKNREEKLIQSIQNLMPDAVIYQSVSANMGFEVVPTWHRYDL